MSKARLAVCLNDVNFKDCPLSLMQAIEVCKVLGGVGDVLSKKLMVFDALAGAYKKERERKKVEFAGADHLIGMRVSLLCLSLFSRRWKDQFLQRCDRLSRSALH